MYTTVRVLLTTQVTWPTPFHPKTLLLSESSHSCSVFEWFESLYRHNVRNDSLSQSSHMIWFDSLCLFSVRTRNAGLSYLLVASGLIFIFVCWMFILSCYSLHSSRIQIYLGLTTVIKSVGRCSCLCVEKGWDDQYDGILRGSNLINHHLIHEYFGSRIVTLERFVLPLTQSSS